MWFEQMQTHRVEVCANPRPGHPQCLLPLRRPSIAFLRVKDIQKQRQSRCHEVANLCLFGITRAGNVEHLVSQDLVKGCELVAERKKSTATGKQAKEPTWIEKLATNAARSLAASAFVRYCACGCDGGKEGPNMW